MTPRVPAFAVVGLAGMLAVGGALAGIATAPSGRSAVSFASQVLSMATVPPGGRATTAVSSYAKNWVVGKGPPSIPGASPVTDEHELYLYDEPAPAVIGWIRAHLLAGTRDAEPGTETGVALMITEPVAVSGPNEYSATIEYVVAPTSPSDVRSVLRVDAVTIWVGDGPADEVAPEGGVVSVTGFEDVSVSEPSGGPVTVTLSPARAAALVEALNSLPLGPHPALCMEDSRLYEITVRPKRGATPSFVAQGWT
ncbi:MAG: hypothetical protein ACRDWE_01850, partial [Acidimicrobiales bacterium]